MEWAGKRFGWGLAGRLWFQVLAAMVVGSALGWFKPDLGAAMKPLGDAFIALVRMMIAPVIFCTVVHGVAGMSDMRRVGAIHCVLAFLFNTTLLALTINIAAGLI